MHIFFVANRVGNSDRVFRNYCLWIFLIKNKINAHFARELVVKLYFLKTELEKPRNMLIVGVVVPKLKCVCVCESVRFFRSA